MRTNYHYQRSHARVPRPRFRWVRTWILAVGAALIGTVAAQPQIVVSIPPYQEIAQRIAGPEAQVSVLLPPGASTHTFEPSPRDLARLEAADLIVLNGGVDRWAFTMVRALGSDAPIFVALERLDEADLVEGGHHDHDHGQGDEHDHEHDQEQEHDHDHEYEHADDHAHERDHEHDYDHEDEHDHDREHDHEHDHEHEHEPAHGPEAGDHDEPFADANPHIWLDPTLMRRVAFELADAWTEIAPDEADAVAERVQALADELDALDAELSATLAPIRGAAFVPFHDAWPYFADRYGLDLVIEIEPFPGREPSARYLAEALGMIRDSGAAAIFAEVQLGTRSARVLADEAGVGLGTLDPLGGVPGRESYGDLLRYNARILVETLHEDGPREP